MSDWMWRLARPHPAAVGESPQLGASSVPLIQDLMGLCSKAMGPPSPARPKHSQTSRHSAHLGHGCCFMEARGLPRALQWEAEAAHFSSSQPDWLSQGRR